MSGSEIHLRIRHSLGLPSLRAAFAGLGHAAALLVFVIAATALKFTASNFPLQTSTADLASFARESAALGAALAVSVPLLVAASNLAPASGWRRYACLVLTTSASILACVGSPLPAIITGVAMDTVTRWQLTFFVVLLGVVFEFRHRALTTAGALLRVEIDGINADARLRDASLRVLQAQVAPHFLFNTLANVRRLAQLDRKAAAAMLGDLVAYFQSRSRVATHRGLLSPRKPGSSTRICAFTASAWAAGSRTKSTFRRVSLACRFRR